MHNDHPVRGSADHRAAGLACCWLIPSISYGDGVGRCGASINPARQSLAPMERAMPRSHAEAAEIGLGSFPTQSVICLLDIVDQALPPVLNCLLHLLLDLLERACVEPAAARHRRASRPSGSFTSSRAMIIRSSRRRVCVPCSQSSGPRVRFSNHVLAPLDEVGRGRGRDRKGDQHQPTAQQVERIRNGR